MRHGAASAAVVAVSAVASPVICVKFIADAAAVLITAMGAIIARMSSGVRGRRKRIALDDHETVSTLLQAGRMTEAEQLVQRLGETAIAQEAKKLLESFRAGSRKK